MLTACLSSPVGFADVTFSDGSVHNITTAILGDATITNATTINVLPGGAMFGADPSASTFSRAVYVSGGQVNVNGGNITSGNSAFGGFIDGVTLESGSQLNISSGTITGGNLTGNGGFTSAVDVVSGSVTIAGGSIIGGNLNLHGGFTNAVEFYGGQLKMTGGAITAGDSGTGVPMDSPLIPASPISLAGRFQAGRLTAARLMTRAAQ